MPRQAMHRLKQKLDFRGRLEDRIADEARFIKSWLENPLAMGAVSPSGRKLATALADQVDPADGGPVIELGPGTGPVTQALLRRGVDPRKLILIEYDAEFCKLLARRFPTARVVHGDAYALAATVGPLLDAPAAAIVSSLPLLTRPESDRIALMEAAFDLLGEGKPFIQFTYGVLSPIARGHGATSRPFTAQASPPVWMNLPPARVWVYRRKTSSDGTTPEVRFRPKPRFGCATSGD
jgi:phosphatidylethanolamine/phosphatidyl-N-methylethanolamine N-methyltransferase